MNDVYPAIQADKLEGGYFSVPRMVLCYVDYLGALYSGFTGTDIAKIATTAKARKYLVDVMGRVDPAYNKQAKALIEIYRHGTVHLHAPIVLINKANKRKLVWECYKGTRRAMKQISQNAEVWYEHLIPYRVDSTTDVLPISINCLYDDLNQSIDEFCSMLFQELKCKGNKLLNNFVSAANVIIQPKPVDFDW